ncbi:hypothetical protein LZ30DRAFT_742821 [Colletotrichum cereale]|nr:hypothetical protein LZ30DRAFT_742821 [Colletotrichum cereale]
MLCYDDKDMDSLIKNVYAPNVHIDYTALFGGKPTDVTSETWTRMLQDALSGFDGTQHTATDMLVELPQPTKGTTRPDTVKVVAYVNAHMKRSAARGTPMMHSGGRSFLELTRSPELEEQGETPWRITKMRIAPAWEDGNLDVLTAAKSLYRK